MNIHIFLKTLYYRTLIASLFHPLLHLVKAGLPPHVEKTKTYKRIYIPTSVHVHMLKIKVKLYTYRSLCTANTNQNEKANGRENRKHGPTQTQ